MAVSLNRHLLYRKNLLGQVTVANPNLLQILVESLVPRLFVGRGPVQQGRRVPGDRFGVEPRCVPIVVCYS